MSSGRRLDVWLDFDGSPTLVGRAFLATTRKGVASTFTYDDSYLSRGAAAFPIDPALPLYRGQHAVANKLVGVFADSAPDRWGRNLIRKQLHAADAAGGRTRRAVTEVD